MKEAVYFVTVVVVMFFGLLFMYAIAPLIMIFSIWLVEDAGIVVQIALTAVLFGIIVLGLRKIYA